MTVASDGPTPRNGETNASGQMNFPGLLAGVYRLRFEGDAVVAFEKEVTIRNGQVLAVDVMLNPAKKSGPGARAGARAVAAPPPAAAAKTGPAGQQQVLSVPKVLEEQFRRQGPAPRIGALVQRQHAHDDAADQSADRPSACIPRPT